MTKKNLPEPVEALVLALLVFFGVVVLSYTFGSASAIVFGTDSAETHTTIIYLFTKILFFIIPLYYATKKGYASTLLFKFNPVSGTTIVFSVVLSISLFVVVDEIDRLITTLIPPPEALQEMMKPVEIQGAIQWFLIFIGSVFISSFAEESMFRGFLLTTLLKKGDPTRAVILTAVSWAIIHPNPYWAIPLFVMGVFIGYVAWKSMSLWPAVIIHGSYNLLTLLIVNENAAAYMEWYTMGDHVSPVVVVLACAGIFYSIKNLDGQFTVPSASKQAEQIQD